MIDRHFLAVAAAGVLCALLLGVCVTYVRDAQQTRDKDYTEIVYVLLQWNPDCKHLVGVFQSPDGVKRILESRHPGQTVNTLPYNNVGIVGGSVYEVIPTRLQP